MCPTNTFKSLLVHSKDKKDLSQDSNIVWHPVPNLQSVSKPYQVDLSNLIQKSKYGGGTCRHTDFSRLFYQTNEFARNILHTNIKYLRWMIPPMVVHPEKIDFRRFV